MGTTDFLNQVMDYKNVLWPLFSAVVIVGIGFMMVNILIRTFSEDRNLADSILDTIAGWTSHGADEKRKNDAPEEKEKPTAWRLGDDGEMVPVVSKRKNDDLFHQN